MPSIGLLFYSDNCVSLVFWRFQQSLGNTEPSGNSFIVPKLTKNLLNTVESL